MTGPTNNPATVMSDRLPKGRIYPCSAMQRQFWATHQMNPEAPASNIPSIFHVRGEVDIHRLQEAINALISKHDVLRTECHHRDASLLQVCRPSASCPIRIVDLKGLAPKERTAESEKLIHTEISAPFDLNTAPLMRVCVIHLGRDESFLIITLHHIISDLRTKEILAGEISGLYNGVDNDRPHERGRDSSLSYGEFSIGQQEWLNSTDAGSMISRWQTALEGKKYVLNLPMDRMRPSHPKLNGAGYSIQISEKTSAKIKGFSRKNSVDVFLTLLAGYGVLLHRYCQQEDIIIGVPLTNRRRQEHKDIAGCFVNILPIGIDISSDHHFSQVLKRTRQAMLHAHRNQEVPLEAIVNAVQPVRDVDRNPLFQVGYTFETPMKLEMNGLSLKPHPMHPGGSTLDLFLILWPWENEIHGFIEYNTDLFEYDSIERLARNFTTLVEDIAKGEDPLIGDMAVVHPDEHRRLVDEWNDTRVDYAKTDCLHRLFEVRTAQDPHTIAIQFGNETLTYDELNKMSNQLARHLKILGVGPDCIVGLLMARSIEMVVGIYGILKAGGAYLPLDPEYPDARLSLIAEDAKIDVLLTQNLLKDRLSGKISNVIALDADWDSISVHGSANPDCRTKPQDLAYVIYTSGSTGRPKGVQNEHQGIINRILWMQDRYVLDADDAIIQKTPYTFDVSVWEFFWPLVAGARLVIAPPDAHKDTAYLVEFIIRDRITTIHFVPSMLRIFLNDPASADCRRLKRVICSGEALPKDVHDLFFERLPEVELHNLYGPTEAAVDVTCWECKKEDDRTTIPIGRPIANTAIHILDQNMQPVPIGVPGELHIGGVQVARGYLNRPDLTASTFVDDPFAKGSEARLYKTGDLARFRADGTIEYIGRLDHQVKISGQRIELGEIENVLNDHPAVKSVVVLVKEFGAGDNRMIAFVVPDAKSARVVHNLIELKAKTDFKIDAPVDLPNGMAVHQLNRAETDFMYGEIFENQIYTKNGIRIEDGMCIFDIGANIGMFSIYAASLYDRTTVYAFEPIPQIFDALEKNVQLYGGVIHTFGYGMSDRRQRQNFTFYPHISILSGIESDIRHKKSVVKSHILADLENTGDNSISDTSLDALIADRLEGQTVACELRTISEVIHRQKISTIDLLKIDVEKSEIQVLNGIEESDWSKIRQIVIEVHGGQEKITEVSRILEQKGYSLVVEIDEGVESQALSMIYARRGEQYRPGHGLKAARSGSSSCQKWYGTSQFVQDIKEYLKELLPSYMVPSAFVPIREIPLTANGKIDRKALERMQVEQFQSANKYIAPQNDIEKNIAEIWHQFLKVDKIGVEDSFFDLGGTSIMSIQMMTRLQQSFKEKLSVVTLFQYPTIRKLAAYLADQEYMLTDGDNRNDRFRKRKAALHRFRERKRG